MFLSVQGDIFRLLSFHQQSKTQNIQFCHEMKKIKLNPHILEPETMLFSQTRVPLNWSRLKYPYCKYWMNWHYLLL